MQLNRIEEALEALKLGKSIIVVDDEDRENEGDLVAVTEWMQDNTVNFMAKHGRGLICAPVSSDIAEKLKLHPARNLQLVSIMSIQQRVLAQPKEC